jgi:hypothetical protein
MRVPIRSVISRSRWPLALVATIAVTSSTTAAAVSYVVAGGTTSTASTTTIKSTVNGAALQVTDTSAGANGKGIGITVPVGHAPISVSDGAGKATNLNADKLDGIDGSALARGKNVTILANRTVTDHDGLIHSMLTLPGFGTISTGCFSYWAAEIDFSNTSGHAIDVWRDFGRCVRADRVGRRLDDDSDHHTERQSSVR